MGTPSLNYSESKPIVVESIQQQFKNYKLEEVQNEDQFYIVKIWDKEKPILLATISYNETKSSLRQGKKLGKLIIEGEHYQPIVKTFNYFYKEEMQMQMIILEEFIKRVHKEVNAKDKEALFFVNFIDDLRFEIQQQNKGLFLNHQIQEDNSKLLLYSRETHVATLNFSIHQSDVDEDYQKQRNLTDYHIKVKIKPTYKNHNKSLISISMIVRDSYYLEKSVKRIFLQLDLDSLINNSFDIFTEFSNYLYNYFKDVETGSQVIVNDLNRSKDLSLDQQYGMEKYIIQADYSRKIQEYKRSKEETGGALNINFLDGDQPSTFKYKFNFMFPRKFDVNYIIERQTKIQLIEFFQQNGLEKYLFSCFESATRIFTDQFFNQYKPIFMQHYLTDYSSLLGYVGQPYMGYNVNDVEGNHTMLFSYLESSEILYIEINDETKQYFNLRKFKVPKKSYNPKNFQKFVEFSFDHQLSLMDVDIYGDKDYKKNREIELKTLYNKKVETELDLERNSLW